MSQNGPYQGQGWPPGGAAGPGEPYAEPADPWSEAAAHHGPDPSWDSSPMSVPPDPSWDSRSMPVPPDPSAGYGGPPAEQGGYPPPPGYAAAPLNAPPPWHQPPAPAPRRRNAPIVALVVVLGLLICGGLGTTALLMARSETGETTGRNAAAPSGSPARGAPVPEPQTSQDARFVGKGQCVRNEGVADESPELTIVSCTSGTYEVLRRIDGRTSGEQDAEGKCSKVPNYTKWYFYDSELDSLDFVLCLRDYGTD